MNTTFVTPVGRLVHPHLNVARDYNNDGKFAYTVCLDIEGDEGIELERMILARAQDHAKRSGMRSPIDMSKVILEALDKDGELIPNTTRIKFKASIVKTKTGIWDKKPAFFDANGEPLSPEPQIGGGTIAQIAFSFYEWVFAKKPGITVQPEGVLIHELKAPSGAPMDRSFSGLFGRQAAASTAGAPSADGGNF